MEPTIKEITELFLEVAKKLYTHNEHSASLCCTRMAAQVEAMGERRCVNCNSFIPTQPLTFGPWRQCVDCIVYNQGPDFGCIH